MSVYHWTQSMPTALRDICLSLDTKHIYSTEALLEKWSDSTNRAHSFIYTAYVGHWMAYSLIANAFESVSNHWMACFWKQINIYIYIYIIIILYRIFNSTRKKFYRYSEWSLIQHFIKITDWIYTIFYDLFGLVSVSTTRQHK